MRLRSTCSRTLERIAALALVATLAACGAGEEADLDQVATAPVIQGELKVTVTEGGDLESANPISVRSEVEGRTTILELVAEGSLVEEGQVLARLDSSGLEDRLNRQEIEVQRARDSHTQAEQAVEIQKKANEENLERARTELFLAERAKKAYEEGTYILEKARLQSEITLAQENLTRAKDQMEASKRLLEEKFISEDELRADELRHKQAEERLQIARKELNQLETWTKPDQIRRLGTDVELKRLAMQRVEQQAASEMKQKLDTLKARDRNLKLEIEARDKLIAQLDKTVLKAPRGGLVVYGREDRGRWRQSEPMAVGKEVREREEIIRIPDMSEMIVVVDVHESSIKKMRTGLKAIVRVDAMPDQPMIGTVQKVAIVPNSQSSWLNPDLKVYETVVRLDEVPEGFKPGMHAQVEIQVATYSDVLQIPMQAVRQSGRRTFAYVKKPDGAELREIEVGASNEKMVEVAKGLSVGEEVFLATPPGAPKLPEPEPEEAIDPGPAESAPATAEAPGGGERAGRRGGGGRGQRPQMSAEMREKIKNMSAEERREYFRKMMGNRSGRGRPGTGAGDPQKD